MLIAVWILVVLLLGLWSVASWGLYELLRLDPSRLGELKPLVDRIPFGDWLGQWLPGWDGMLRGLIDLGQVLLGWLGSAAPLIVGVVWAGGALLLLAFGGVLSLVVALIRRAAAPAAKPA